jgi:hypothetical protein
MNKDIKQLAEERLTRYNNVEWTGEGLPVYSAEQMISAMVEMYTAGAREATCSLPLAPTDDEIETNGKEGGLRDGELQLFWEGAVWMRSKAKWQQCSNVATTTPLSSSSGDAPVNSNNSIELITALLSGKQLVKIHEIGEKETFWCEKGRNGRSYFWVQGWGSALGRVEDRMFDVINNPEKWRIELQNDAVSDTTKGDSSKEAGN